MKKIIITLRGEQNQDMKIKLFYLKNLKVSKGIQILYIEEIEISKLKKKSSY